MRPFVYRLAMDLGLKGWVLHGPYGVIIEVDGNPFALESFAQRVVAEKPQAAVISAVETVWLDFAGYERFEIKASEAAAAASAWLLTRLAAGPDCGTELRLEREGAAAGEGASEQRQAAGFIRQGQVVAMKGLGGSCLLCDARNAEAVKLLRERQPSNEKPSAVMFPDLDAVQQACEVSALEADWLASAAAPIVLLRRWPQRTLITEAVAPGSPWLAAKLPSTSLHHLLMKELGFPVVAATGTFDAEPVSRHDDDSIVRLARGRQLVLRRARGLAPLPLRTGRALRPVLALGAHLKDSIALGWQRQIVVSRHLSDRETAASLDAFRAAIGELCRRYGCQPTLAACDLHPDAASSRRAESLGMPIIRVQHHHAHVAALMAEQDIAPPVLGVAWDGAGLGTDGSIWGGEFLIVDEKGSRRFAHLRAFPMPGGEAAAREPRRCALGLLQEMGADLGRLEPLFPENWEAARRLPQSVALSPRTSSAGRLFAGLASLLGLRQKDSFEGQAAMALEHCVDDYEAGAYGLTLAGDGPLVADWKPLLAAALEDRDKGVAVAIISARFHNGLAKLILQAAQAAGLERVALSGGVFQNAALSEKAAALLEAAGFKVYTHQRLPPNDGGIPAGQAYVAGLGWHP